MVILSPIEAVLGYYLRTCDSASFHIHYSSSYHCTKQETSLLSTSFTVHPTIVPNRRHRFLPHPSQFILPLYQTGDVASFHIHHSSSYYCTKQATSLPSTSFKFILPSYQTGDIASFHILYSSSYLCIKQATSLPFTSFTVHPTTVPNRRHRFLPRPLKFIVPLHQTSDIASFHILYSSSCRCTKQATSLPSTSITVHPTVVPNR